MPKVHINRSSTHKRLDQIERQSSLHYPVMYRITLILIAVAQYCPMVIKLTNPTIFYAIWIYCTRRGTDSYTGTTPSHLLQDLRSITAVWLQAPVEHSYLELQSIEQYVKLRLTNHHLLQVQNRLYNKQRLDLK